MIWIIASIPFWTMGGITLLIGAVGIWVTMRDCDKVDDRKFKKEVISVFLCMGVAGILLLLAAKICS